MSTHDDAQALLAAAAAAGTISQTTATQISGNLGNVVLAGAAGKALEDITATDVTLVTVLIDASSSIKARDLEQAIRDGHAQLVKAFSGARERDSILLAVWSFNSDLDVVHSYLPVDEAVPLTDQNYQGRGQTRLYDTWCDALTSNVVYAQRLRDGGTPTRSVVVVITDGEDFGSRKSPAECARLSKELLASETFTLAFVGVGTDVKFDDVAQSMGVPAGCILVQRDATASSLRRTFQLVSQSAIRASQGRIQPGVAAGFFSP